MFTLSRTVLTALNPEKKPCLLGPVIEYGMHGNSYSARTTLWFAG
jgi:hypothetical protein